MIEEPLIAPLSRRECAFYYIHVEKQVSSGENSSWRTIIEEEISSVFLVRQNDHYAFINDSNLKCYVVQDNNYSSGFLNDATIELENYLGKNGHSSEGFFGFNKSMRYKEGILEKGEKIAVLEKGNWKDASSLKLSEKYGKILEITSSDGKVPVYLSDDPSTTLAKAKKLESRQKKENRRSRYNKNEGNYRK